MARKTWSKKPASCAVHTRMVGYVKPVEHFSLGKKQEMILRHTGQYIMHKV